MRKDKAKVVDEVWTEDRVKSFLTVKAYDEVEQDFHMLLKAYQSMRVSDFTTFLELFVAEGHDVNAANPQGATVLSMVTQHRNSGAYAEVLRRCGAH